MGGVRRPSSTVAQVGLISPLHAGEFGGDVGRGTYIVFKNIPRYEALIDGLVLVRAEVAERFFAQIVDCHRTGCCSGAGTETYAESARGQLVFFLSLTF